MPTRFILLCQPRTGSSCLEASLRQHPEIRMLGEVLNHRYDYHLPAEGYARLIAALDYKRLKSEDRRLKGEADGASPLSSFSHQPPASSLTKAVGCDLKAFQPDRNWPGWRQWEPAWEALADDPSIRVIHLVRQDVLAQLASWKVANALGNWGDQSAVRQRPTIRIDPQELRWFRQWNQAVTDWRLSLLRRHRLLTITYESLCTEWPQTLRQIQEFLDVEPIDIPPAIQKNETRPLDAVITNWAELKRLKAIV